MKNIIAAIVFALSFAGCATKRQMLEVQAKLTNIQRQLEVEQDYTLKKISDRDYERLIEWLHK